MKLERKLFCLACLYLVVVMTITGCNSTVPAADTTTAEPTAAEVKYVPMFNACTIAASLSSRSVSYTMPTVGSNANDPKNVLFQIPMIAPVILSVSVNTNNYKVGDSFESVILGNAVTTVITSDESGNVIFTGKWADEKSYYKFTVTPEGKVLFEQHVNLTTVSDGSDQYFVVSEITDASINDDGSFTSNDGTSKCIRVITTVKDNVTTIKDAKYYYKFKMGTSKDSVVSYVFQATESQSWWITDSTFTAADLDITSSAMLSAITDITPDSDSRTYADDDFILIAYCNDSVWNMVSSSTQEETIGGETKSGKDLVEAVWAAL